MDERDRDPRGRNQDLVLPPGTFAFVLDRTKGEVMTHVGPTMVTMSGNDTLMTWDKTTKSFVPAPSQADAIQNFVTAPAGWYVELLNPVATETRAHPKVGTKNSSPEDLLAGKKVVLQGPVSFALWPGQMSEVVRGHRLRSNQYLTIEIYDAEAARSDWSKATIETVSTASELGKAESEDADTKSDPKAPAKETAAPSFLEMIPKDLANGRRYVIKGTEVAFYIPPSGVKVVKGEDGKYVQDAVTLEKLEFCVLLSEDGAKTFVRGEAVVFPSPTQRFKTASDGRTKKFRAIELNDRTGIHVRVIEDYEEGEKKYQAGQELFITGEGVIYWPRKEHAIITVANQMIHHAVIIPQGSGRYLLDERKGTVEIVMGPKTLLPDPRHQVIIQRILTDRECDLLYPGNSAVKEFNRRLAAKHQGMDLQNRAAAQTMERVATRRVTFRDSGPERESLGLMATAEPDMVRGFSESSAAEVAGDRFERQREAKRPDPIVFDERFEGPIWARPFTNFALKLYDASGKERVVVGPRRLALGFDETPESLTLSTGTPKNHDKTIDTAYLQVRGNEVTEVYDCVTKDLVQVRIKLTFTVNFEGEPTKWFNVPNYIKTLVEHAGSILKAMVRSMTLDQMFASHTELVRDTILGRKPEEGDRPGMSFVENGMHVVDVNLLDFDIVDEQVRKKMEGAQADVIDKSLAQAAKRREAEHTEQIEELQRRLDAAKAETAVAKHKLEEADLDRKQEAALAVTKRTRAKAKQDEDARKAREEAKHKNDLLLADLDAQVKAKNREVKTADQALEVQYQRQLLDLAKAANEGRVEAAKKIAESFSPQLVAVLTDIRNGKLLEDLGENFADLSILRDEPLLAVASKLMQGLPMIGDLLKSVVKEGHQPARDVKDAERGLSPDSE